MEKHIKAIYFRNIGCFIVGLGIGWSISQVKKKIDNDRQYKAGYRRAMYDISNEMSMWDDYIE